MQMKVAGFQGTQRNKLTTFEEKCESMSLQIKGAGRSEELEKFR